MRFLLLLFILFGQFNVYGSDQIIHLDSNLTDCNLGKHISYFEDKSAKLTLGQIKDLSEKGQFKKGQTEILNFGNTKSAFWIKVEYIRNSASKDYLVLDISNIDYIDVYINTDKGIKHRTAGSIVIPSPGVIATNNYIFDLPTQTHTPSTLWLKLKTNNILIVPIKIVNSDNFIPGKSIKNNLQIVYLGILLTLLLFNFFLYFSLRDSTYLYYSLYVFSLGIYMALYLRGYSYLFGQDFRILLNLYPHAFLALSIIASVLFSKKFLNLKSVSKFLVYACDFILFCSVVMLCTSITGFKSIASHMAQFIAMAGAVVLWSSGFIAYRKGHKPAKYYIIAWSFIAATVVAVVLSLEGILTYHDYTFEFVPIGSTIELLLLAFALGDRYRTIINSEQQIRDENYSLVQTQNQRLEKLVEERTLKLSDTIAQLKASNAVKNKLFSIIAHDLRSPFSSLISIFSLKDMDLLSLDELKILLNENRKNIDTIHNTLNNLLYWAQSQMEGVKTIPTAFDIKQLIEDLALVYSPLIQAKGITINLDAPDQSMVFADENQIQLVLRNLIDNAIKFTPSSHGIDITLKAHESSIKICVNNTISQTNELNIDSITNPEAFETTYGTGHEKGIGLGLHLCREYIKGNGSELKVTLSGRLVSFCFKLPLPQLQNTIVA
ncbi:Signal transduction histidine kinase [Pedobacter sp. ok626]|uniref:sensor histidine kinase n=1 Tax=Pedobacter sp. ok626 TaxID=1761882 RepID=UPI000882E1F9|nr:sensor histidine kinase [Pedobacter sp. ok626]SDL62234.1 Signal transduction histidine kinase [Pedobacter sp. ok626]